MTRLKTIKINLILLVGFLFTGTSAFALYDFLTRESSIVKENLGNNSTFTNTRDALQSNSLLQTHSISYYPDFASNFHGLKKNIFPINGISNIRTYYCNEQGYLSNYTSDMHGFNNSNIAFSKNSLNIALIGDSYIHGACTNKSSIQENLSKSFPDLKIASFAQGGAGPLLELAFLKEFAIHYRPKLVYWVWVANDLRNLQDELQSPLRFYMQRDFQQGLYSAKNKAIADSIVAEYLLNIAGENKNSAKNHNASSNSLSKEIKNYFPKTYSLLKKVFLKTPLLVNRSQLSNPILTREQVLTRSLTDRQDKYLLKPAALVLSEAKSIIESNGGKLIIIYLGFGGWDSNDYVDKEKFLNTNTLQESFLKQFAEEQKIKFFNLSLDIDSTFSRKDHIQGHFSDEGYKKVSEIIANYIRSETILDRD